MKLIVEFSKGVWEFSVEGSDGYVDNFEVLAVDEAIAAATDLMKELSQHDDEDDDPFEDLLKEE
jgi:hypothetical protein